MTWIRIRIHFFPVRIWIRIKIKWIQSTAITISLSNQIKSNQINPIPQFIVILSQLLSNTNISINTVLCKELSKKSEILSNQNTCS